MDDDDNIVSFKVEVVCVTVSLQNNPNMCRPGLFRLKAEKKTLKYDFGLKITKVHCKIR